MLPTSPIGKHQTLRFGTGRETLEVLDTMSNPPASARDDEHDERLAFKPLAAEAKARELTFGAQEQRVTEGTDTFEPSGKLARLQAERLRLDRIHAVFVLPF